jgi:hypothetical protein
VIALAPKTTTQRGGKVILDALRDRRPPFSPADVVIEFAATLRSYGIGMVQSDTYAGGWVVEACARHGVRVEQSAKPKSDLYVDLLPLLNSRRIELLDHPQLVAQLCGLERRTARSGRDSIDHPPSGRDDLANAVAGAAKKLRESSRGRGNSGQCGFDSYAVPGRHVP